MYFITGFFLSPNINKPVCGISMKFVHLSQFPVFKTQSEDTARTGPNIVSNDTCYCVNWPLKRLHREQQQRQPTTTGLQVKAMSLVLMKPTLAVGVFILWLYFFFKCIGIYLSTYFTVQWRNAREGKYETKSVLYVFS